MQSAAWTTCVKPSTFPTLDNRLVDWETGRFAGPPHANFFALTEYGFRLFANRGSIGTPLNRDLTGAPAASEMRLQVTSLPAGMRRTDSGVLCGVSHIETPAIKALAMTIYRFVFTIFLLTLKIHN